MDIRDIKCMYAEAKKAIYAPLGALLLSGKFFTRL